MLHIVNGDSVAEKLRQGIVQGDVLVWREVYPHGPVFLDPAAGDNRDIRARYLEQTMGIPYQEYLRNSEEQEKTLAGFHQYEEIILWFEHDLFDQTMLCFLLDWFSKQDLSKTKLSLLCIGEYPGIEPFRGLGQLSLEQMETLSGTWKSIGDQELELGQAFWKAYTSREPGLLQQLLSRDTSALPFAQEAFRLHLLRFPSIYNGLGIVEQTTLEMVDSGINCPYDLFDKAGGKLHGLGIGDLEYWHTLRKMSRDPFALLRITGLTEFPGYNESSSPLQNCNVAITEFGKNVLNGKEDWVERKGINEWYGGVHLQGTLPRWRWDSSAQKIKDKGSER